MVDGTKRAEWHYESETRIFEEIGERYPWLKLWWAEHGGRRMYCLTIMKPANVRDVWHRIVHDHELRERARGIIHPDRVNEPGDNAVLVIAPVQ